MLIIVGLRDLWMAIQVLWLAQYGYGPLPVHFVGKAGTALLMISIVSLIFADLGTNTFFTCSTSPRWPPASGHRHVLARRIYLYRAGHQMLRKELGEKYGA